MSKTLNILDILSITKDSLLYPFRNIKRLAPSFFDYRHLMIISNLLFSACAAMSTHET